MKRRGSAFIFATIGAAALLSIVALAASRERVNFIAHRNALEMERSHIATDGAMQLALSILADQAKGTTIQTDTWYTTGTNGAMEYDLPGCSFRLQIIDANSRFDMNTASEALLQNLGMTSDQIASLEDWREAATTTTRTGGGKDDYYHGLTNPYNTALQPLSSFDELLQVRNWTAQTLYQPQTTITSGSGASRSQDSLLYDLATAGSISQYLDSTGTAKANLNTATLQQLVQSRIPPNIAGAVIQRRNQVGTFANFAAVLDTPGMTVAGGLALMDGYRVGAATTGGKLNLNTAPLDTISLLPGMTTQIANDIFNQQSTGVTTFAGLSSIQGLDINALRQFADLVTLNSQMFIVRVAGTVGSTTTYIEGWIRIDGTSPVIDRIETPPFSDMATHWSWDDVTQNTDMGGLTQ